MLGVGCLVFGVRCLVFGVWCLVFGARFSLLGPLVQVDLRPSFSDVPPKSLLKRVAE